MSALFPDTHPKMEALQIELWRQASPTRKMQMLAQLNASARLLAMTGQAAEILDSRGGEVLVVARCPHGDEETDGLGGAALHRESEAGDYQKKHP